IYIFRDAENRMLYVGKSIKIRQRIKSHLQARDDTHPRLMRMYRTVHSVDWIETRSELLALLLEDGLIKSEQPLYNKRQKNQKAYRYLTFSSEKYPRLKIIDEHQRNSFIKWYGPFYDRFKAGEMVDLLHHLVPLRTCADSEPKRKCLKGQIGQCLAPCKIESRDHYVQYVDQVNAWLSGHQDPGAFINTAIAKFSKSQKFRHAQFIHEKKGLLFEFQRRQAFIKYFVTKDMTLQCLNSGLTIHFLKGQIDTIESDKGESFHKLLYQSMTESQRYDRAVIIYGWLKKASDQASCCFYDTGFCVEY
ncbi:hypothetical protein GF406_18260, partial [candidate division KSB1 bacterium]|nr:hypothetical protein [candidate division KSB1 bacterium]